MPLIQESPALEGANRRISLALAAAVLALTLFVILWGAWVRISHSGDGCGAHWPLCHGELIPAANGKTWVEYLHRLTSGLLGVLVVVLVARVRRTNSPGSPCRSAAHALLFLTVTEALLGAKLVLFGLVGSDTSAARALAVALHLVNTLLLLGTNVTLIVWLRWSGVGSRLRRAREFGWHWLTGSALVILAMTGAWAALANTLFPSSSLWSGLLADFQSESHFLVRVRLAHPVTALLVGLYITVRWPRSLAGPLAHQPFRQLADWFVPLTWITLLFGLSTLLALAPVWMKLTHLLLADLVWISWVTVTAGALLDSNASNTTGGIPVT